MKTMGLYGSLFTLEGFTNSSVDTSGLEEHVFNLPPVQPQLLAPIQITFSDVNNVSESVTRTNDGLFDSRTAEDFSSLDLGDETINLYATNILNASGQQSYGDVRLSLSAGNDGQISNQIEHVSIKSSASLSANIYGYKSVSLNLARASNDSYVSIESANFADVKTGRGDDHVYISTSNSTDQGASTDASIYLNLSAGETVGGSFFRNIQLFDNNGDAYNVNVRWEKIADQQWSLSYSDPYTDSVNDVIGETVTPAQIVTFGSDGRLQTINGEEKTSVSLEIAGVEGINLPVEFDLRGVTQNEGPYDSIFQQVRQIDLDIPEFNSHILDGGRSGDDFLRVESNGNTHVKAYGRAGDDYIELIAYDRSFNYNSDIYINEELVAFGGRGDDTIIGANGADRLYGGSGDDSIIGHEGNDRLYGQSGNDTLYGDEGRDRIYGGTGDDYVSGDEGNDRLYGQNGTDRLDGGADNDRLYGGGDNDTLFGGEGSDRLYGQNGDDVLFFDNLDRVVDGGSGNDVAVYDYDYRLNPDASDETINLTDSTFRGVEAIDFTGYAWEEGGAVGEVNIDLNDVLDISDTDNLNLSVTDETIVNIQGFDTVEQGQLGNSLVYSNDTASLTVTTWGTPDYGIV